MSLIELSATEQLERLASGGCTSVELVEAYLNRIDAHDEQIGAYLRVNRNAALESAAGIDARRKKGEPLGKLAGLPVAVKDVLCTEGEATTCASKMLEDFRPPYNATVITRLKSADAVLIGKTNMDEFAMGASTENSAFQATRNPWDTARSPGGSSGGSAACVAAAMAPLALGTDTGGSIRQPASFCGVTGMKPTYGRVSRYGLIAFASSLDQIGPFAQTVEDVALILEILAGYDSNDSTCSDQPVPNYRETVNQPIEGLKIGVVREHYDEGLEPETEAAVREAIAVYKSLGAEVREISLPHSKYAVSTYYIIAPSEASSNLARYDGIHYGYRADEAKILAELRQEQRELTAAGDQEGLKRLDSPLVRMVRKSRSEGFGDEVKRRVMLGTYTLSAGYYDAYYLKSLKVRRLISQDFEKAFAEVDVIASPTSPTAAFRLGEKQNDPMSMYLVDLYTVSANLTGNPGISVPCGRTSDGLPIGLQLQAPAFEEERLLRAANMYQQATEWHKQRAEL